MKIHIKHMVSHRCKMIMMSELKKVGLDYITVELGTINLTRKITKKQKMQLRDALEKTGLELIEDKRTILVEQIKITIIELIHNSDCKLQKPFSTYLSSKLNFNYIYLSNLFSELEGCTIANFIIKNRIERVKEFIQYNELSFSEIAFKMHYSSIAHLSCQFKKMTGITLSEYRKKEYKRLLNIENL